MCSVRIQVRSHGGGVGGSNPPGAHASQTRLVGFAQIRWDISSFRGYPCIPGWPEHSKYRKTAGRPGLRPEPRWGSSQRSPRPLSWSGGGSLPPSQKLHPSFGPLGLSHWPSDSAAFSVTHPTLKTLASRVYLSSHGKQHWQSFFVVFCTLLRVHA